MQTSTASANNGTAANVTVRLEGYVDDVYSGDYGPNGDYLERYFPEYLGDYSEGYESESYGDPCEDEEAALRRYGPEYAEYCAVAGTESAGPESMETLTPQWGGPTFLTPVVFLILAVQLSVVVFLLVRGRKEKTYRQGFYLFFVAVTFLETITVVASQDIDSEGGYATVLGLPYYLGWPITRVADLIIFFFLAPIIPYAQSLLHLAIVATRFTAFCFPLAHSSVWISRNVLAVFVVIAALSIPLGVGPPVFYGIRKLTTNCSKRWNVVLDDEVCGIVTMEAEPWKKSAVYASDALFVLFSTACYVVSFFLNMCSVTMLVVMRVTRRLPTNHHGTELRLFVHSLFVFLLQAVMVIQTFAIATDEWRLSYYLHWFPEFPDSAEWLAGKNTWDDPIAYKKCHYYNECGLFYGLLSGYWRFGVDQKRMENAVRNLTPFAFALCGPVSLLAISDNVRNGYFRFYLKCLRRRRERTHVVQVVSSTVIPSSESYRASLRNNRLVL